MKSMGLQSVATSPSRVNSGYAFQTEGMKVVSFTRYYKFEKEEA